MPDIGFWCYVSAMTEDRGPAKKPPMRDVLAEAAFGLFMERGFERTTVDDIVARAGVGRRSFFRYFPSKEDAVFPDHERCLADMTAFLEAAGDGDPVDTVCDAARLVLRMYAVNPEFSVQRYRLTREVPGLRTYELSVVRRYERTLAGYLERRGAGDLTMRCAPRSSPPRWSRRTTTAFGPGCVRAVRAMPGPKWTGRSNSYARCGAGRPGCPP